MTTQKKIQFRTDLRPSDAATVRRITSSSGYFSETEIQIAVELVEEAAEKGAASGYLFLFADFESLTAGYSCWGPIPLTKDSYDMYWIAVDEEFRRKRLGTTLLRETEERIARAGGKRIFVDTSGRSQYSSTRAFYESKGYSAEARLRDFYAKGDDRIIYRKDITDE